jgi:type IV pilus assembly protein PilC
LSDPGQAIENVGVLARFYITLIIVIVLLVVKYTLIFWPFLLYFWASLAASRQRTMLALIQTAYETGTPADEIIRIHAAGCSFRYGRKLTRLADAIRNGKPLAATLSETPGLARYDVLGIIHLGGGDQQTLETLNAVADHSRRRDIVQSNSVVRTGYLLVMCIPILWLVMFMNLWIVPEFQKIFEEFGLKLPTVTMLVFDYGMTVAALMVLAFPFVALALTLYLIMQTDAVTFRPFGLRRLFRSVDAARFLRVFGTGLKRETPLPEIIAAYRRATGSAYLARLAERIDKGILAGRDWIDVFQKTGVLTTGESRLLESARRAGNLVTVVDRIADGKESGQAGKNDLLSKFVFTPCILLIGSLVGVFVTAMFLPVISLIHALAF